LTSAYRVRQAGTTTLCRSQQYPPYRDFEFDYSLGY
jgi:hypothetical protein